MGNNPRYLKALLAFVICSHWAIIIGNVTAFAILPFYASWYVALPLMSYIGLLTFSRVLDCPLTRFENKVRTKLGLVEVKGFISFYAIKPYARFKRSLKKKRQNKLSGEVPLDIHIPSDEELAKHKYKKNVACDVKTKSIIIMEDQESL
jgi:hypothetical protein